jgi:hypothetical protein
MEEEEPEEELSRFAEPPVANDVNPVLYGVTPAEGRRALSSFI